MSEGQEPERSTGMEVAIIGMAGRFPGARNVEEFWRNLRDGVESLTLLTDEELIARGANPSVIRQPHYVKAAFEIADHDRFDAAFFGISPREAEVIEPQQRLFLECAWEALEDAGYDPERLPRRVGTYAGSRFNGYLVNVYSNPQIASSVSDLQIQIANDKDYLATRISYKLNLGGPSLTVQSACSTALVAIHLASQALLNGECDLALAGGVGVRVPETGYPWVEGEVNTPDGHVRAFDAKANGTIFGSGLGIVVLKRLEDALADGDAIRAVLLGSAITNDGSLKVGFTAPGVDGQARVVRAAQLAAEVEPETVSYIEAHGTGTPVGDPIEMAALTRVFQEHTDRKGFCAIGSVKTNIGHLGAAAGVAGVIKTVLALERRMIPPSLHFEEPNPQIDFASSPFYVNTRLSEWPRNGAPRRAGVSAFGIGGTNAHVILEEAPELPPTDPARPWQLLFLSARTPTALERASARLADHLESHPELDLADAAYTLLVGRKRFPHRRVLVCRDRAEAIEAARSGGGATGFSEAVDRPVAFLFSGQGAQYPGMGADLYETQPTFREEVDRCAEILVPHLGLDLREWLVRIPKPVEEAERRINRTAIAQPALFVLEYCLARLWMEWGIAPQAMLGHSIGEYAAACLAGVFSLPDALALVASRGRLMQSLPAGAMLSVPVPAHEVERLLAPPLSLAAVNAPGRSVVSGPEEAVEAFRRRLEEQGLTPRRLHTSHAFHSEMMEPILAPFIRQFEGIELQPPQIPYLSNVTGTWITAAQATDPGYWARHLRQPVRFADGVRELWAEPERLLLEVGPGNALTTLALQSPERAPHQTAVSSLPQALDRQPARKSVLKALGQLWLHGAAIDPAGLFKGERRRRVPLPTYPFERERFWVDPGDLSSSARLPGASPKRNELEDWFYLPFWKPSLAPVLDGEPAPAGSRWLVFLDGEGAGTRIVERLRQAGQNVVAVEIGERFTELGERSYAVSPARREDYDALLRALMAAGEPPELILHLWNLGPRRCATPCPAVLEDEERSFWSLLFLAQACGKQNLKSPLRLAVLSSGLQRVADEESLCPGKATLLGPVRIIPLEYPHIRAASIDVLLPAPGSPAEGELVEQLLAEVAGGLPDPIVAYRGRWRFLLDYQRVRIGPAATVRQRFRQGGAYLITGGLGGLGLVFAEFLAREHQARLALLGLSPLPPREEWAGWLALHGEHDRVCARIRKVQELEELGAEVLVLAVDVADEGQMRQAVEQVRARFGALHGVIHAAGLAGGGLIQLKTPETAARVLAPKIRGTLALDAALAGQPLDFLLLCSSTIAVLGGLGQVDYCAANSFLDAFAQERALRGDSCVVSINWGAWQEVGMAVAAGLAGSPSDRMAAVERTIHPLLDRCQREMAEQTIYETDFCTARQWVLSEHRVLGQPTVPGTCYLEMACAAFQDHASVFERRAGEAGVEIREALFLTPLRLAESGIRTVQTVLEPEPEGEGFAFRVLSRPPEREAETATMQIHARGKVGPLPAEPGLAGRRDLEAIRQRCNEREVLIDGPVMSSGEGLVYWGPRWQSLKRADVGSGEILALLELPPEFASDLGQFTLHPALLDVATSLMGFVEAGSHLPISYQRMALRRPLPGRLYSHLRKRREGTDGRETVAVDITLMDENGEVVVEIERFVMKQVTEASSLRRPAETATAAPPAGGPKAGEQRPQVISRVDASDGILSQEGVEVVRRVLSRGRDLPQVVASAKDLQVLLAQVQALDRSSVADRPDAARGPRASHARPNLNTPYVAPRTPLERQLAEAFQQALGLQEVGIHDNFFDLGGDSIVGIQVVARANEAGLALSPDQLFENQTVAELASLITPTAAAEALPPSPSPGPPAPDPVEPLSQLFADSGLPAEEIQKALSKLKEMNL
jgi:phthiocerol/phenolphthiocerol synthesis type-I polyketide synthase E